MGEALAACLQLGGAVLSPPAPWLVVHARETQQTPTNSGSPQLPSGASSGFLSKAGGFGDEVGPWTEKFMKMTTLINTNNKEEDGDS